MKRSSSESQGHPQEIVFVLRLRAGSAGWWGQVRRVDDPQVHYVRDIQDLMSLLATHWQTQHEIESDNSVS